MVLIAAWLTLTSVLRGPVEEATAVRAAREKMLTPLDEMSSALNQILIHSWQIELGTSPVDREQRIETLKGQLSRFDDFRTQYEGAIAGTAYEDSGRRIREKWAPVAQSARELAATQPAAPAPAKAKARAKTKANAPATAAGPSPVAGLPAQIEALTGTIEDARRAFDENEVDAGAWPLALDRRLASGIAAACLCLIGLGALLLRGITRAAGAGPDTTWEEATRELTETLGLLAVAHHRLQEWVSAILDELHASQRFLGETSSVAKTIESTAQDALHESQAQAGLAVSGSLRDQGERAETSWTEIAARARAAQRALDGTEDLFFQLDLLAVNLGVEAARAELPQRGFLNATDAIRTLTEKTAQAVRQARTLVAEGASTAERSASTALQDTPSLVSLVHTTWRTSQLSRDLAERCLDHLSRLSLSRRFEQNWSECAQASATATERLQRLLDRISSNLEPKSSLSPADTGKVLSLPRELMEKPLLGEGVLEGEKPNLKAGGMF
jgi:hypothetical protein